ncbi:hypothetical protein Lpp225_2979 [Lacticaseibacillus paracasei subsp. paracasei Lpp225]|uniref:Uncharacterized protein n=2 Tax=Lacticaseibacillus paracasei subsp. paracasei TaxID=47714 RepID=S2NT80_LACPA|nr:hypothetical protein Lpp226_2193 [Lacticaseibacillus paracasei subsp. paracasei Lpp226]EPC22401.1 hypothetical protein Lpp17_2791 [Lacticaseibacillus paracasei subsp. paracasei Lpp17]EPC31369.1 hypothetical protein Lpp120_1904 [Lacticaseibacillus paracasei subsp. paracasei Lpp120]EPC34348.1 hypothetical protein Lpp225_2979 [Lacticaseibacillus paracasei subsp. paracasei Lpp225]KTE97035.1 hypothetical protein AC564_3237c [Lacticaseibacillus paracasei]QGV17226.1 Hypothetical protein LCAKO_0652
MPTTTMPTSIGMILSYNGAVITFRATVKLMPNRNTRAA